MKMATALDGTRSEAPQWRDRADRISVPMARWGVDHWSLLTYVEARWGDHHGLISWDRLTLSRRNWPMLWAARNPWAEPDRADAADMYGLRLKGPDGAMEEVKGCCEGDALMDLVENGLVVIEMPPVSPTGKSYLRPDGHALNDPTPAEPVTGRVEWALMPWARFTLTDKGSELAASVRRFRGTGGSYGTFIPAQRGS